MIRIGQKDAWNVYEQIRHRLPEAASIKKRPETFPNLCPLFDRFDLFLLDAFGVLNIGNQPLTDTSDRINALRRAGKHVMVVSNNASAPVDDLATKYQKWGHDLGAVDIITSRLTMLHHLDRKHDQSWGIMASRDMPIDDLHSLSLLWLEDISDPFESVDGFLFFGSYEWTWSRQRRLMDALVYRPRPLVVANPDIAAPQALGFSAEPGYFAHQIADETEINPVFFGKPFPSIFDLAITKSGLKIDRSRILMVGDSLHTDILGAQAAGIASALVTDVGFMAGQNIEQAMQSTGIFPDFLIRKP